MDQCQLNDNWPGKAFTTQSASFNIHVETGHEEMSSKGTGGKLPASQDSSQSAAFPKPTMGPRSNGKYFPIALDTSLPISRVAARAAGF